MKLSNTMAARKAEHKQYGRGGRKGRRRGGHYVVEVCASQLSPRERERDSRGELTDRERDRERVTFFARRTCERVSECVNAWVSE